MAVILEDLLLGYDKLFYEYSDQRTIHWPLMRSPIPILVISALYLWFVLKAGPEFMKNRQPFQIDRLIQAYNIVQVILCGHLAWEGVTKLYGPWGKYSLLCEPLDWTENDFSLLVVEKIYLYFSLKLLDLCDTVFFVLRKKNNQVSFLHVFHHVAMLIGVWVGARFFPGGHLTYIGVVNSIVHTIMYGYYFLSNYNKEYCKNIWWKKYITQLQMFQFASILVHGSLVFLQPSCTYPKWPIIIMFPLNLLIFLLFANFYNQSYLRPMSSTSTAKD